MPILLEHEVAIPINGYDCLPCQLLLDARLERTDWQLVDPTGELPLPAGQPDKTTAAVDGGGGEYDHQMDFILRPLLPAQGALFVTNYRVIFKGVPRDPYR